MAASMLLALAVAATGCGSSAEPVEAGSTFIPLERDFQGYRTWASFRLEATTAKSTHVAGAPRVFINKRPVKGSKSFAPGTIIVKEVDGGASSGASSTNRQLFAAAKRGGSYNKSGALGWEWLELSNRPDGSTAILWRGVGPPAGESYGGDPNGGCNTCHTAARANDFVQSAPLQLEKL